MRPFPWIFGLLLLLAACQEAPTTPPADPATDRQIAENLIQGVFDDLWAAGDSTKILDYHTPDFVILEQGEVWDNDRILAYMRGLHRRTNRPERVNRMEYLSIDRYGTSLQIAYFNEADFVRNDSLVSTARWLESALAVQTPEGWRLKMMHSTRAPKPD